jgi:hypothetical protein
MLQKLVIRIGTLMIKRHRWVVIFSAGVLFRNIDYFLRGPGKTELENFQAWHCDKKNDDRANARLRILRLCDYVDRAIYILELHEPGITDKYAAHGDLAERAAETVEDAKIPLRFKLELRFRQFDELNATVLELIEMIEEIENTILYKIILEKSRDKILY